MDAISGLVTLLGNGFFPIVVCGLLFWYTYKRDQQHKSEMDEMRKALENNTLIVQQNNDLIKTFIDEVKDFRYENRLD